MQSERSRKEKDVVEHMKHSVTDANRDGYSGLGGAAYSNPAERTTENLRNALRINEATNESGYVTIGALGRQRETIQHSLQAVGETHNQLQDSRSIINRMRIAVYKEWFIKGCVIVSLVLLIILIFYVKFIRK